MDSNHKLTEADSYYNNLESLSVVEILEGINSEDQKVALAVQKIIPNIEAFLEVLIPRMRDGGRLFYLGAGTSGRLGILDASECPPTFGVSADKIVGLIAGGDRAIRKAQEFAEDDPNQAWTDLSDYEIKPIDTIIGIAASGSTPYVLGALKNASENGLLTACVTCNPHSPIVELADHPMIALVGPEFITGSTRMKSGTAQKLILNMISTTVMIQLGHVKGNKMIDMQLTNEKLIHRGVMMILEKRNYSYDEAKKFLLEQGSVRRVLEVY